MWGWSLGYGGLGIRVSGVRFKGVGGLARL